MSRFSTGWRWLIGTVVLALAAAGASSGHRLGARTATQESSSAQGAPVVVELYTSQGCSSCPAADRFLAELAARGDDRIIALSFHVDYWNYIGWTDPFSSEAWSDRQRRYARMLGSNRIYTPQMVVNGRWEGVGSNRRDIAGLLERASAEPRMAEISASAELTSDKVLRVAVIVDRIDSQVESNQLAAWVAVVEDALVTAVGRGENASKSLRNDRVVRSLRRLSGLEPFTTGRTASLEITLDDDWRRDQLTVVTFLQDTDSLRMVAATQSAVRGTR